MGLKASEVIVDLGKSMYGEDYSLSDTIVVAIYKKVYDLLVKRALGKSRKGLLIVGGIGVGKSAMMKIMQRLFKNTDARFKWVNAYQLKDLSEVYTISEIKQMYGYEFKGDLYIDDIGFSVDVKRYGNTVNIISEILMERYDLFINAGFKTHISSNLLPSITNDISNTFTLKTVFGLRLVDRIKEMCDIIIFKGESKRI